MPAAVSDTHSPDWLGGSPARTVLLSRDLSTGSLLDAMRAHRGYATLDENLGIHYTLDGAVMGSTLPGPAVDFLAEIRIEDPDGVASDALTLVELVSDGGVVAAPLPASSPAVHWQVSVHSETARFFYVRVTTASDVSGGPGVTAWTAPVWTGR
jgi:hypothetical protein